MVFFFEVGIASHAFSRSNFCPGCPFKRTPDIESSAHPPVNPTCRERLQVRYAPSFRIFSIDCQMKNIWVMTKQKQPARPLVAMVFAAADSGWKVPHSPTGPRQSGTQRPPIFSTLGWPRARTKAPHFNRKASKNLSSHL
jgi:hypothetical protein